MPLQLSQDEREEIKELLEEGRSKADSAIAILYENGHGTTENPGPPHLMNLCREFDEAIQELEKVG